jgi:transcriptional regulator with XRE-family HTH domain
MDRKSFGENVSFIREKILDLPRTRAAMMALIGYDQLLRLETGDGNPTLDTLFRLADRWGVHPSLFFLECQDICEEKNAYENAIKNWNQVFLNKLCDKCPVKQLGKIKNNLEGKS